MILERSPDLGIGITLWHFHTVGNSLKVNNLLNSWATGSHREVAQAFKTLGLNLSQPIALVMSNVDNSSKVSLAVIFTELNCDDGVDIEAGKRYSLMVKIELKTLLKEFDIDCGSWRSSSSKPINVLTACLLDILSGSDRASLVQTEIFLQGQLCILPWKDLSLIVAYFQKFSIWLVDALFVSF